MAKSKKKPIDTETDETVDYKQFNLMQKVWGAIYGVLPSNYHLELRDENKAITIDNIKLCKNTD